MLARIYHEMSRRLSTFKISAAVRRKGQLTVKTDRVLIIQRRHCIRGWCEQCGNEVEMVREEEANALTCAAQEDIPNGHASDEWHRILAAGEITLVCLDSVLKSI